MTARASSAVRLASALVVKRERAARGGMGAAGTAVAVVLAVPVFRATFLSFLDDPERSLDGLAGVGLRLGLGVMVAVGLDVHERVLRGGGREVWSLWPVPPDAVVREALRVVAARAAALAIVAALWLSPVIGALGVAAWAGQAVAVAGAAALAVVASTLALLGAIRVAEDPAWAPLLDAVRGANPRPQAALIYALVPSTGLGGMLVGVGAWAAAYATVGGGGPAWALALLAAPAAAVGLWPWVDRAALRSWYPASQVLAEIRARYAAIEDPEEARRVGWDWTLRWLPAPTARVALLVLRYGWRERRTWISAGWLVAVAALAVGWTDDPDGPVQAGALAAAGAWLGATVAARWSTDTPPWLAAWLPVPEGQRAAAVAWSVLAWAQPAAWAAISVGLIRHGGMGALGAAARGELGALAAAVVTAGWGARVGPRAWWGVAALGAVASAATALVRP